MEAPPSELSAVLSTRAQRQPADGTEFHFSSQRKKDSQIGSQSKSNLMLMEETPTKERRR